ncbi:MAG: hypothetical protein ABFR62_09980 [Bacteroidota bacterium]
MANSKKDSTFQLIKTLSKAEKRNFRLYAKHRHSSGDLKFVQLFDTMDKIEAYDEEIILKKVKSISKGQLSNQKAHLYKILLSSLRHLHKSNSDIQVRENLDYARLLYNKGLYMQSLKVLDKTKVLAKKSYFTTLHLEVVEFEKEIESRYITRSIEKRAENLSSESCKLVSEITSANQLSNFALSLYDRYLKEGFVKSENDYIRIHDFFINNLPKYEYNELDFFSKLYLYQSHVWYHLITQDFKMCFRYAQKWVDIFESSPHMIDLDPDMYLKGIHNLLNALHHVGTDHHNRFIEALNKMESFNEKRKGKLNENSELLSFLYLESNRINNFYMTGEFSEGVKMIPYWEEQMAYFKDRLDPHRILVFYYKFASLLFGAGKNKEAIRYLNKIINFGDQKLREDIHVYSRLLMLIAHFELGNEDLLEYQIKSVYRYLAKLHDLGEVHKEIFKFLKRTPGFTQKDLKTEFKKILKKLKVIRNHPYDKRPFLYLDLISWLESRIEGITVEQVIKEKFLGLRE